MDQTRMGLGDSLFFKGGYPNTIILAAKLISGESKLINLLNTKRKIWQRSLTKSEKKKDSCQETEKTYCK